MAWLDNKDYVAPSDIKNIAHEVLRHRIGLTFEAESMGLSPDQLIDDIISSVALP